MADARLRAADRALVDRPVMRWPRWATRSKDGADRPARRRALRRRARPGRERRARASCAAPRAGDPGALIATDPLRRAAAGRRRARGADRRRQEPGGCAGDAWRDAPADRACTTRPGGTRCMALVQDMAREAWRRCVPAPVPRAATPPRPAEDPARGQLPTLIIAGEATRSCRRGARNSWPR